MYKKFVVSVCLLCAFSALFFSPVSGADARQPLPRLKDVRTGVHADKIRVVLEFDVLPANYRTYLLGSPPDFAVRLSGCRADGALMKKTEYKDKLLFNTAVTAPTFRDLEIAVGFRYALPAANIKTQVLTGDGSGPRLVFDFYRKFQFDSQYSVSAGTRLFQTEKAGADGYLLLNELFADLSSPAVSLRLVSAGGTGREETTAIRRRADALAAVNGGFFSWTGGPLGLVYHDGRLVAPHVSRRPPRTALARLKDGSFRIERLLAKEDGSIHALGGGMLSNIDFALGGGPRLVKNGAVSVNADEEELGKKGNDITRLAGRTAFGIDKQGNVRLFTANGYWGSHSEGIKLENMAAHMIGRGVVDGLNFDGGDSSVMDIAGFNLSRGPGNTTKERPVGNALCLYDGGAVYVPYRYALISAEKERITADGMDGSVLEIAVTDAQGCPVPDGTAVKVIPSAGVGPYYVKTEGGKLNIRAGALRKTGEISITLQGGCAREKIWTGAMVCGAAAGFFASITPPGKPLFPDTCEGIYIPGEGYKLQGVLEDAFGNGVSLVPVKVEVLSPAGDTVSVLEAVTGQGGLLSLEIPTAVRISAIPYTTAEQELSSYYVRVAEPGCRLLVHYGADGPKEYVLTDGPYGE